MNVSLIKAAIIGAIAGGVGGIMVTLTALYLFIPLGLIDPVISAEKYTLDLLLLHAFSIVTHDVFWGLVLGIFFFVIYDKIPGKGIMKGLIYSMAIYFIANIRTAHIIMTPGILLWPKIFVWVGLSYFITFGIILGYFFKKE